MRVGIAPLALLVFLAGCAGMKDSMPQQAPSLALGEEYVPAGEATQIAQIVALHRHVQEQVDRQQTPVPRGQHAKQHGLVRAEFIVEPDLPANLRYGVFSQPQTLQALIRFSNGRSLDDNKADAHGMAIKLLGVEGEQVLAAEPAAHTQDFVLIDSPIFFVKNAADYVPLMKNFDRLATGNLFSKARAGLTILFSQNYKYRLLRAAGSQRPASPLAIRYWGTTPSKLGPGAMKFSARPCLAGAPAPPASDSKDKLRLALSAHLAQHEALFDFLVQVQTDPVTMPVEDPTIPWDEAAAPFIKVATIRIPIQSFESPEQMAYGEQLSFTPWHALADLRPLGGINRARAQVYAAIAARRHELNGVPLVEPGPGAAAGISP